MNSLLHSVPEAVPSLSQLPPGLDLCVVPQLGFLLGLAPAAFTQVALSRSQVQLCPQLSYLTPPIPLCSSLSALLAQFQFTSAASRYNLPSSDPSKHGAKHTCVE